MAVLLIQPVLRLSAALRSHTDRGQGIPERYTDKIFQSSVTDRKSQSSIIDGRSQSSVTDRKYGLR